MAPLERIHSIEELRSATLNGAAFRDEAIVFVDAEDDSEVAAAVVDDGRPVRGLSYQFRESHLRVCDAKPAAASNGASVD